MGVVLVPEVADSEFQAHWTKNQSNMIKKSS